MQELSIELRRQDFTDKPHQLVLTEGLTVTAFRYATGVEALLIENLHGHLIVLPYMGQMVWDAEFSGVNLTMGNSFGIPRPATTIAETYGCFAFHSGMLRNGVPSPQDTHAAHGEMPCASMDSAGLIFGEDEQGTYVEVTGEYEYVMGFGAHYVARPSVRLYGDATLFDIVMDVENLSYTPMELMYMCHVNFAFEDEARIIQPTSFTPENTKVRTAVPGHVTPTPDYLAFIDELAKDPSAMEVLDDPERYNPEQVFYLNNLKQDENGTIHQMMKLEQGDAFAISYPAEDFPKCVRWVLVNGDAEVAAFALPSTCEPEGYLAEKAKGNVRLLASGERATFPVRLGYLAPTDADEFEQMITAL